MKQYQGEFSSSFVRKIDTGPCVNVDSDWYPDSFLEYYNKTITARRSALKK